MEKDIIKWSVRIYVNALTDTVRKGYVIMSKVKENKEKKRRDLVEAAYSLFSEKGMVNTSISDIVSKAGVAKGTFYLYFNDKYDIANMLIYQKSSVIFSKAIEALEKVRVLTLEDEMTFIADNIINQLSEDKVLLDYFSKAIDWGCFKKAVEEKSESGDFDFLKAYDDIFRRYAECNINQPEIMFFMIFEFITSICYSPIKYGVPASLEEIKPYIFNVVKSIVKMHLVNGAERLML